MRVYIILFIFFISISCNRELAVKSISVDDYALLDSVFASKKSNVEGTIAPVFVENISPGIKELSVKDRKEIFIKFLMPVVLRSNETILSKRNRIIDIYERYNDNRVVSGEELLWIDDLSEIYRTGEKDFDALLKKVDMIPPSLIIAQAIVESGWGTSRFAIEGNSLFGEHFSNGAEGSFISANNSDIKLRTFESIEKAVDRYCINLNRHRAYKEFREKRFISRQSSLKPSSIELAEALGSYSEKGSEYIINLKQIIRKNSLQIIDDIILEKKGVEYRVLVKS
ncbi:MAG: glucosaminidase domain-containing protein [Bacteroidota bacterium]